MTDLQQMDEILSSWRRCMEKKLSNLILIPNVVLNEIELQKKIDKECLLLNIFKEAIKKVNDTVLGDHNILLTDVDGIILWKLKKKI